jgi:hypothetical protein
MRGPNANDLAKLRPALIAAVVMFERAVIAIVLNAMNFLLTPSIPSEMDWKFTLPAAA